MFIFVSFSVVAVSHLYFQGLSFILCTIYMCQYINLGSPASFCKSDYSCPYIALQVVCESGGDMLEEGMRTGV
jgi:hypothetical protein